jgi:hypothetical protein
VLAGGVFQHPTERLADATMAELPGAVPVRTAPPAVAGATLLALDRLGVTVDAATVGTSLRQVLSEQRSAPWAVSRSSA